MIDKEFTVTDHKYSGDLTADLEISARADERDIPAKMVFKVVYQGKVMVGVRKNLKNDYYYRIDGKKLFIGLYKTLTLKFIQKMVNLGLFNEPAKVVDGLLSNFQQCLNMLVDNLRIYPDIWKDKSDDYYNDPDVQDEIREKEIAEADDDEDFQAIMDAAKNWNLRPTPEYEAPGFSEDWRDYAKKGDR